MAFQPTQNHEVLYQPFEDYLGLSTLTWSKNLLYNLEQLMTMPEVQCPADDSDDTDSTCSFSPSNLRGFPDTLDSARCGSLHDFRHNGRECALDEIDSYQMQLRQRIGMEQMVVRGSSGTLIQQVMDFKERKKASRKAKAKKHCVFCKNNGETTSVYSSHLLRDPEGRVTCPILRKYTCPLCGVSGDNAHTIKYCPSNQNEAPSLVSGPLGLGGATVSKKKKF